jgi:hypothetical protein
MHNRRAITSLSLRSRHANRLDKRIGVAAQSLCDDTKLMCNDCAITVESRHHCYSIAAQSLCKRCAAAIQMLRITAKSGFAYCTIAAQSLLSRCEIAFNALEVLRCRFVIAALSPCNRFVDAAQSLCNRCVIITESCFYCCTIAEQSSRNGIAIGKQHEASEERANESTFASSRTLSRNPRLFQATRVKSHFRGR